MLLLTVGLVFSLSACGSESASDSQLQTDLESSDVFRGYADSLQVQIRNLEITKRQTDEANKTDTIWVEVDAVGDSVQGNMYFTMTYGLYNEGWLFDSVATDRTDEWVFTPLAGLSEEALRSYTGTNAEILSNEVDLGTGLQVVTCSERVSYTYCDIIYNTKYTFSFGSDYQSAGMWNLSGTEDTGTYEEWNIDGTWQYTSQTDTEVTEVTVTIDGFDPQGIAYRSESPDDFSIGGSYQYYGNSQYMLGTTDLQDEDGLTVSVERTQDGSVYYRLYTDCTTYGNRHFIAVYPDRLILNPWNGLSLELTKVS